MKIDLLNEKIMIQRCMPSIDKIGNHINLWCDYYSCHATISGESPKEIDGDIQIEDNSMISFTIRYCTKVSMVDSTNYRVKFKNQSYEIIGIDHQNYKKHSIKLYCRRLEHE